MWFFQTCCRCGLGLRLLLQLPLSFRATCLGSSFSFFLLPSLTPAFHQQIKSGPLATTGQSPRACASSYILLQFSSTWSAHDRISFFFFHPFLFMEYILCPPVFFIGFLVAFFFHFFFMEGVVLEAFGGVIQILVVWLMVATGDPHENLADFVTVKIIAVHTLQLRCQQPSKGGMVPPESACSSSCLFCWNLSRNSKQRLGSQSSLRTETVDAAASQGIWTALYFLVIHVRMLPTQRLS